MMKPFTEEGADLLHLDLSYDQGTDNFSVKTKRIVDGFKEATDAVLIGKDAYIIEYGANGGNIWKISFP
jgi:S-adenosylhomocysteine hydrolase